MAGRDKCCRKYTGTVVSLLLFPLRNANVSCLYHVGQQNMAQHTHHGGGKGGSVCVCERGGEGEGGSGGEFASMYIFCSLFLLTTLPSPPTLTFLQPQPISFLTSIFPPTQPSLPPQPSPPPQPFLQPQPSLLAHPLTLSFQGVSLKAYHLYKFQAMVVEKEGGDYLQVGWRRYVRVHQLN